MEQFSIGGKGFVVPVLELGAFGPSAFAGIVVELLTQEFTAEALPIIFRVEKVEVPGFVYGLRWGDGVGGRNSHESEAAILLHYA